jgi:hypothetical protein
MTKQRAVATLAASLTKSIEKLAVQRDRVKTNLDELESELKLLLSMLKIAGDFPKAGSKTQEPKAKTPKAKTPKAKTPKAKTPKAKTPKAKTPKANEFTQGGVRGGGGSGLGWNNSGFGLIALKLAAKGNVTPDSLAAVTAQTAVNASNALSKLARAGKIKRVSRGVYGAA